MLATPLQLKGQLGLLSHEGFDPSLPFMTHPRTLLHLSKYRFLNNGSYRLIRLSQPHTVNFLPAGATAKVGLNHAGSMSAWGLLVSLR